MLLLAGAALASAVAFAAYRFRALTLGGAVAAAIIGTAVFAAGGLRFAAVLFAFFIPSTLLSRIGRARKRALADVGKHGPRDARQVAANGAVAALCAVAAPRYPQFAAAFAGAFAAASADTWATEIGTLARQTPRSILSLKPVAAGISGGITAAGTLAQFAGACAVAIVAAVLCDANASVIALGGFAGATLDSVLGASLQQLRYCPACERDCETDPHHCGTATQLRRGVRWIDNDAVNFAATAGGAICALALTRFFVR